MKKLNWTLLVVALVFCCAFNLPTTVAEAATTPSLGAAADFGILAHHYNNTSPAVNVTGDVGYVVAPAVAPTITGTTHINDATYLQAVADQSTALAALNSQACTFTFAAGAVDLVTDTTHGPAGTYAPGVYCISGSMAVGGGGTINLSGAGTYIFRPTSVLTTSDLSHINAVSGASACNIFWTPGGNTTLGTSGVGSTFTGTVIEDRGPISLDITVNDAVTWIGRALNGDSGSLADVTTGIDVVITKPTCSAPPPLPATLHVIKTVYNDYGGTAVAGDFNIHVKLAGVDVTGSPAVGLVGPVGRTYTLAAPNTYVLSEDPFPGYTAVYGNDDCDYGGSITLAPGDNKTCTVSNDQDPVATSSIATTTSSTSTTTSSTTTSSSTTTTTTTSSTTSTPSFTPTTTPTTTTSIITTTTPKVPPPPSSGKPATLHVIKHVINDNGGTAVASIFTIYVKDSGFFSSTNVTGSPAIGVEAPGTTYTLSSGTYVVSEGPYGGYSAKFSGDCDVNGKVSLAAGDDKTCTITNDDIAKSTVIPKLPNTSIFSSIGSGISWFFVGLWNHTFGLFSFFSSTPDEPPPIETITIPVASTSTSGETAVVGFPARLKIPKLKVDAGFQYTGLKANNELDGPTNITDIGWFKDSARPGDAGTSVVTGHLVQIRGGKITKIGVFNQLKTLVAGDKLYIEDNRGQTTTFVVRESKSYDPDAIVPEVFTSSDGNHLNIITCGGVWHPEKKSYSERLVIFTDRE